MLLLTALALQMYQARSHAGRSKPITATYGADLSSPGNLISSRALSDVLKTGWASRSADDFGNFGPGLHCALAVQAVLKRRSPVKQIPHISRRANVGRPEHNPEKVPDCSGSLPELV